MIFLEFYMTTPKPRPFLYMLTHILPFWASATRATPAAPLPPVYNVGLIEHILNYALTTTNVNGNSTLWKGGRGEIFFIQFLSFFSSCLNIYVRRCLKNEKLNEKGLWIKIFEKKIKMPQKWSKLTAIEVSAINTIIFYCYWQND